LLEPFDEGDSSSFSLGARTDASPPPDIAAHYNIAPTQPGTVSSAEARRSARFRRAD
jgi:hypothetical protein